MPITHRFFFVITGTVIFSLIFLLGISFLMIFYCIKYIFMKSKGPVPPEKPTSPEKPSKPSEPGVGASKDDWNRYRSDKAKYKDKKKQWKKDCENYKSREKDLMQKYYEADIEYKKAHMEYESNVLKGARDTFLDNLFYSTIFVIFCRKKSPEIMNSFLKKYERVDLLKEEEDAKKELISDI